MEEKEYITKYIENKIKDLKEKIANREAMIAARGDQLSPNRYEELKKWKEELNQLQNSIKESDKSKTEKEETGKEESGKEETGKEESGKEEPEKAETAKNRYRKNLPELNLKLNMQTGECVLSDIDNGKEYERKIESRYYTKEALKSQEKFISENFEIDEEGKKYLKNIDPTILNSYLIFDKENDGKYNDSAARMYIEAVLNRAQKLAHGEKVDEEVAMPGKIEIDLRKDSEQEDKRNEKEKFKGLAGLFTKHRAKKILENHGENRMNLAQVLKDKTLNRLKFILGFGATSVALIAGGKYYLNNHLNTKAQETRDNFSGKINPWSDLENDNLENNDLENEDLEQNDANMQSDRIQLGTIVSPERYSLLYKSTDSMEPSGALGNVNKSMGVNKIACVIDGKTYTTKDYSADEIYEMAEKAGVDVRYHLDEATMINGKNCVQVMETGSSIPTYVYADESGKLKYLDGREFTGDVESGIGWVNSKDCEKSELTQENQNPENIKNSTENELER